MIALITGVSSGIGKSLAIQLSNKGYDIIGVSRKFDDIEEFKRNIKTSFEYICLDLSNSDNVDLLLKKICNININMFVNNAGFGLYGSAETIDDKLEQDMINLNIIALQKITKYAVNKYRFSENRINIINIASIAGFMPGPLMATYYATKSYVISYSLAIAKELEVINSNIKMSVVCPGPVDTKFNDTAKVGYGSKPLSVEYVSNYIMKNINKRKKLIIPGIKNKIVYISNKFFPRKIITDFNYKIQVKKVNLKNK